MSDHGGTAILRNAILHTQPRPLRRLVDGTLPAHVAATTSGRATVPPAPSIAVALPSAEHHASAAAARGHDEGFRNGFAEGIEDAKRRVDDTIASLRAEAEVATGLAQRAARDEQQIALERLRSIGSAFEGAAFERLRALEADAVELAFAAVCKIVGESAQKHERIEGVVRAAMTALHGAKLMRVRVHPSDLALLSAEGAIMRELAGVEWLADSTVDRGGCMLDADRGSLDARLATQLARLRDRWLEALNAPAAPSHLSSAA